MYQFNDSTVDLLERIQGRLEEDANHDGATPADNQRDPDEALNLYLDGIADALIDQFDYSEDEAMRAVLAMADTLGQEGVLPEFPSLEAAEDEIAMWLGAATTLGFANEVLTAAANRPGV